MNENNEGTVVGANVKLQGTISDNNDIVVHGSVEGEVISEKNINITPSASVVGPVRGQIIIVAGTIKGDVLGEQKVEVLPTARISGSIAARELIIQSGAIFNGQCQMAEEAAADEGKGVEPEEGTEPEEKERAEEEFRPDEPDEKYLDEETDQKKSDKSKPAKKEESILDDFELE